MIKKILALLLGLTFVFSLTACGEEESEFIEYNVTQSAESSTVSYEGKNLPATEIDFAKAETPENLYAVFGETETGKTDVEYLGRVQIIDGKVVIGLSVGEKPRMAGIYVTGFGYYFIDGSLVNGEYAISLKNVPHGTFQMSAFSIVEDNVIVSDKCLSFTKDKALLLAGESENGYTLEYGKLCLNGQKYESLSNLSFVVSKNSVLSVGEVSATVQGNAGVALGVYGSTTNDISKASYVYAGIKDGKATLIDYTLGVPTVLGETVIADYQIAAEYALVAKVEEGKVTLVVNGNELLSVNKAVEGNRNVGFACLSSGATVSGVSIPSCSLEEYKAYAKSRFDSLVEVEFYVENITGLTTSYITKESKSYNDASSYMFVAREYDKAVKALENATDISSATTVYNKYMETLTAEVLEVYKEDIENSLKEMSENWYSIINFDEDVKNYPTQDKNEDGRPDVSIIYVGGAEDAFNIGLDGLDTTTWDRRWWIPMPLRTPNILTSAHKEIAKCNSKDVLTIMYEEYYDAVLRSVCQKVIEEYHAIKHIEDDGFLWAYNWNYCGDEKGSLYTFVYDGPVTEYQGVTYGVNSETVFRLSPLFYNPNERGEGIMGNHSIVECFNYAMTNLK